MSGPASRLHGSGRDSRTTGRGNPSALRPAGNGGVQDLQRSLGNRALLQLLEAQAFRQRLAVADGHDADERAADDMAARVMSASRPQPVTGSSRCSCGAETAAPGPCSKCQAAAKRLQRRASGDSAAPRGTPAVVGQVLQGPGQPLDRQARDFMEPGFGVDFGHVRVHTGPDAASSADAVGAVAYTVGHQLVFGHGQYAPGTQRGLELIAHELAHVLQQGAGGRRVLRRRPRTDLLLVGLSPEAASSMSDADLDQSMSLLRDQLLDLPQGSPQYEGATHNLLVLEAEVDRRKHAATPQASPPPPKKQAAAVAAPQLVARPPGLPINGGYELVPADNRLPPSVTDSIPEGELVTLRGSGSVLAATGQAMNVAGNSALSLTGFMSAGENAVGLIGMPSYDLMRGLRGIGPLVPESISTLGHTAAYVRVGNNVVAVRGFTPRLLELLTKYGATVKGANSVAGNVSNDAWLFGKFSSQSVEWRVPPDLAKQFLQEMDQVGELAGTRWTGVPAAACQGGTNCVLYAVEQVEGKLGSRVTVATQKGPVPLTDMGSRGSVTPRTAAQGKFIEVLKGVEGGSQELGAMEGALGPAVGGSMRTAPRYIQVLKYGGRIFFVLGAGASVAEVVMAPQGERTRTAVGAGAGFVGGLGFGAAAGLVCGPGAPVCSVVLGLGFGIGGALLSRAAAESIYDDATGRTVHPPRASSSAWMYPGTCFAADTMVLMADRTSRPIGGIRAGDTVLGCKTDAGGGDRGQLRPCEVTAVFRHPPQDYCEITLPGSAPLHVTPNHRLLVNGDWMAAGHIRPGDVLAGYQQPDVLVPRYVQSIGNRPAMQDVCDISVAGCHTYFAGGLLAHNKGP